MGPTARPNAGQGHCCHLAAWTPLHQRLQLCCCEVGQQGGRPPGTPHPWWAPAVPALLIASSPMGSQHPQGAFRLRSSCCSIPYQTCQPLLPPCGIPSPAASPALRPTVRLGGVCPVAATPQAKLNKVMGWRANPHLPQHVQPSGPCCAPGCGWLLLDSWLGCSRSCISSFSGCPRRDAEVGVPGELGDACTWGAAGSAGSRPC